LIECRLVRRHGEQRGLGHEDAGKLGDWTMIQLDLPSEIEARLRELATETGCSMSQIAQLEDLEDVLIAERRLEEFRAGSVDTVPLATLLAGHGVED
jgi:RHH-type rel operon transcriptional repressor/antitoxin RelB